MGTSEKKIKVVVPAMMLIFGAVVVDYVLHLAAYCTSLIYKYNGAYGKLRWSLTTPGTGLHLHTCQRMHGHSIQSVVD
jgi:hypothetical protein